MGFTIPFFNKKNTRLDYFGLYLTDSSIFGFVFKNQDGITTILSQSTYSLTAGFDKVLEDVDNLISELELKTNLDLERTIFFLHTWMIDQETFEIKEPYKGIIQNLSKGLELKPLGYIDVFEALERYFVEKSIVNTVGIEVNKSKIGVHIYVGNRIVHRQYAARTDDAGDDINSVFRNLPKDIILPKTLRLFGDVDKAELASQLAEYSWDDKIFPAHPTIEIIKDADLNLILSKTCIFEFNTNENSKDVSTSINTEFLPNKLNETEPPSQAVFGFRQSHDVLLDEPQPQNEPIRPPVFELKTKIKPTNNRLSFIDKIKNKASQISLPKNPSSGKNKIIISTIIIISVIIGLIAVYEYFIHSLHIKIFLNTTQVDKTFEINLPIKTSNTEELAIIKNIANEKYSKTIPTTGSREVGEKATGTVIIHNFDNTERTFTSGTKIIKDELVYTLDSDVKVDKVTEKTAGTKESGKKEVGVTASEIGPVYNAKSGTKLQLDSLSDALYYAIVSEDIKGGTREEVPTVSTDDIEALQSVVEKQAKDQTDNILGASISEDDLLIEDLVDVSLSKTSFSGEVGEEARSLKVDTDAEIEYFFLKKSSLTKRLKELLSKGISSEYIVDPKHLTYTIEGVDAGTNDVILTVDTVALTHKAVDEEDVKMKSKSQSLKLLESKLISEYGFEHIEIEQPFGGIPFLSNWTPLFTKNITISTSVRQ